jgi:NitT/TauT family transport system ATP-binding protein
MDLITVDHVSKRFPLPDGKGEFTVLGDVTLSVHRGEVLALLGRSGSGKSTLLRIMSGLIRPSQGEVRSNGLPMRGANPNLAMVFQSFALLPWLTVQENVELGLAARHVPLAERRERALKAIDIVGLDGFENAYPKELSGGMKQRVGFARAFVLNPEVLFMDEPFSALDVLTAENLRGEIDDLWNAGTFPSKSILIVTHNIEEAVYLADRVVILGSKPGRIRGELQVNLPRPHDRNHPRFKALVDYIYSVMTNPDIAVTGEVEGPESGAAGPGASPERSPQRSSGSPFARPLPHVRVGGISGLLELVAEKRDGDGSIPQLAQRLQLEVDDLLPLLDAAVLLGFAEVADGDVRLQEKENRAMRSDFFLGIWDDYFPLQEAERQLATTVDWGRYAELFEYDAIEGRLYLPS